MAKFAEFKSVTNSLHLLNDECPVVDLLITVIFFIFCFINVSKPEGGLRNMIENLHVPSEILGRYSNE